MGNFIARLPRPIRMAPAVATILIAISGTALADLAVIPPAKDNTLIESATGSLSNGAGPAFFAGRTNQSAGSIRRAVIFFDIASAIPQGATITSVALTLSLSGTNAGPSLVTLHRVLAEWGESTSVGFGGSGAPSAPGDATWRHTFYDTRLWISPGGDFDPAARASALVDQPELYLWGSTPDMVADVQSWLDIPDGNHGWILLGDETLPGTVKRFDSRESLDPESAPSLQVEFTPKCDPHPAEPGYWKRQCLGAGSEQEGLDPGRRGLGPASPTEPAFVEKVIPCADRMLEDLGFTSMTSCETIAIDPPADCPSLALRDLATLVFNLCSDRLQASCPVSAGAVGCSSGNVGQLIEEAAALIRSAHCRQAARCARLRNAPD